MHRPLVERELIYATIFSFSVVGFLELVTNLTP